MKLFVKNLLAIILSAVMAFGPAAVAFAYEAPEDPETGRPAARALSKLVAEEGMVLLKNNAPGGSGTKALPMAEEESVAVFGINQINYYRGGGGSGDFTSEYSISLWQGLTEKDTAQKLTLYKGLSSAYQSHYNSNSGSKKPEMPLTSAQVDAAAAAADTAIITIGRMAGEGGDRSKEKGDYLLSDAETDMINQVKAKKQAGGFNKIIVVLNVVGVMDTSWFVNDADIDAALLVYTAGMEGGRAMADVMLGYSYPSGKLVDTWAASYADYPSSSNFGNSSVSKYEEDIFVGYRYFETIPGAAEKVNYEFGYGLSYADFEINGVNVDVSGTGRERTVNITAAVTNNSAEYSGKEVVEVYYGAPEDKLTQPKKELAAFVKTPELAPGESKTVTLSFPFDDMASYDDVGKTGNEAAYVLEAGEYKFYVGNSVKNASEAGSFDLGGLEVVQQLQHRLVPNTNNINRRLTSSGDYEPLTPTVEAPKTAEEAQDRYENPPQSSIPFIKFKDVLENPDLLTTFVSRMSKEELVYIVGCSYPDNAAHRTAIAGIPVYGIPKIGTSNGPAGIQHNNGSASDPERNTTFFPSATMQASTWNVELIEMVGAAIGYEGRHFGMSLLQGTGMNIHRDPLCGRNFEYFSEDPLITGRMGAVLTKGLQSQKFASQMKHFALNNQELGRIGNDSRVSERALREIYLKGYEITVKEADPWSIMSAYNRINGTYTSESYALITEILRGEWGWDGFVMTDFNNGASHLNELLAGHDLKSHHPSPDRPLLLASLKNGSLQRWQLERSAERILRYIMKTGDADEVRDKPFTYDVSLSVENDKVTMIDNPGRVAIIARDSLTWGEFKAAIDNHYNQTYKLTGKSGAEINDDSAIMTSDMKLVITAEDDNTSAAYTFKYPSLSLHKPVKASSSEWASTPRNAVDGEFTTRWSTTGGWGHWIAVDLGDTYNISQILTSWYNGQTRTYNYEIWLKAENDSSWNTTSKDKDFAAQGYTQALTDSSVNTATKAAQVDLAARARYVVIKATGGSGASSPAINEIEVVGWKLESEDYVIDEAAKTILVPYGETKADADSKLKVNGSADLRFDWQSETVRDGDEITVVDDLKREAAVYTLSTTPFRKHPAAFTDLIIDERRALSVELTEGMTCQWYTNTTASDIGGTPIDGATGTKLSLPSDKAGSYYYYCVSDGKTSAVATVNVTNDLALRKPVRASYEENGNPAPNVNDGDDVTRWSAYNAGDNQWIEFDLGDVYNIDTLTLMPYSGNSRIYEYEIWVKTDPDKQWSSKREDSNKDFAALGYTKAAAGETKGAVRSDVVLPSPAPARYIAVKVPGGRNGYIAASFHSINIYGWKLMSSYTVDEVNKKIYVPESLSSAAVLENSYLVGGGKLNLTAGDGTLAVKDETGKVKAEYTLENYFIGLSVTGSDVAAEFNGYNGSNKLLKVFCLLAEYDGVGKLVRVLNRDLEIGPGSDSRAGLSLPDYNPAHKYKAFMFDSSTLAPVVKAASLTP